MSRVLPELHHSFLRTGQMLVGSPHLSTLKQCLLKTSFMIPSLIRTWEASKQETPPHRSCIRSHRIAWRKILDMNWILQWIKITWIPLSNQVNLLSPYFSKKEQTPALLHKTNVSESSSQKDGYWHIRHKTEYHMRKWQPLSA